MAIIGSWGDIIFSVKKEEIKTFEGMKWSVGAKYSTHTRHLKAPLLEFTGVDVESISFSMFFSTHLGVTPKRELDKLLDATKQGEVHRMVLGTDNYGKWVIEKLSIEMERVDNRGNLLAAKVSVTMKSYADR